MDEARILRLFFDLVALPSPSLHERPVALYCARYLRDLGLSVRIDDAEATLGADTGNVIATLPGQRGRPGVLLSAHMDTVPPCAGVVPRIDSDGVIWSDGATVLGADDKAGLTAVIAAIEQLTQSPTPHGPVTVVFTIAEEQGFRGSHHLQRADIPAAAGLVLDFNGPLGSYVARSPAQARFEAVVEIPELTSYILHQKSPSTIQVATRAVAAMPRGRIDRDTTVSVTRFQRLGADGHRVQLVGEARSLSDDKLDRILAQIETIFQAAADASASTMRFKTERLCGSYDFGTQDKVRQRAEKAIARTGLTPTAVTSQEGSDANVYTLLGIPTVNLGMGYDDMHTTHEHIRLSDIVLASQTAYHFCCLE